MFVISRPDIERDYKQNRRLLNSLEDQRGGFYGFQSGFSTRKIFLYQISIFFLYFLKTDSDVRGIRIDQTNRANERLIQRQIDQARIQLKTRDAEENQRFVPTRRGLWTF